MMDTEMKRMKAVWRAMRACCSNPKNPAFRDYGDRGIRVCEAWLDFDCFFRDMGPAPKGALLERVDNDAGYSKANCAWVSRRVQNLNKRSNVLLTIDGETNALCVWAERFGIKYATAHQRITKYGWSPEEALKTPLVTKRKGIPRGQKIHSWGAEHGVTFHEPAARAS